MGKCYNVTVEANETRHEIDVRVASIEAFVSTICQQMEEGKAVVVGNNVFAPFTVSRVCWREALR